MLSEISLSSTKPLQLVRCLVDRGFG